MKINKIKKSTKLISVLMPVYNAENYVEEAIRSILVQSYNNFEFLILDDFSSDKTLKIIKNYIKLDKRIKLFTNKKNIGLTKSLIKLIKFSKGSYIARMDSDDISHPERFRQQLEYFKKNPSLILIGTNGNKINKDGKVYSDLKLKELSQKQLKKKLIFNNYFIHSSLMFKKKFYLKVGGYRGFFKYAQDYDLLCRMSKVGEMFNSNKKLINVRYHNNSLSFIKKKKQNLYAIVASCCYANPNLPLKDNVQKTLFSINKIFSLKKHFNCLRYLYSKFLPRNLRLKFFQLSFNEKIYILKDPKFFLIKSIF